MTVTRRSFLIGLGAVGAVAAVRPSVAAQPWSTPSLVEVTDLSKLFLGGDFDRARLSDLSFCMRGTDMPTSTFVNYTIYRHEQVLMRLSMHPLTTMRWVAAPGASIIITKDFPIRLEVEPCGLHSLISLQYDVRRKKEKIRVEWQEETPGQWMEIDGNNEWLEPSKAEWVVTRSWFAHFNETFDIRDGQVHTHEMHAIDPEDEHLIGRA